MDEFSRLDDLIGSAEHIVFLGGAGLSTESGIPDFRSSGGIYSRPSRYPPEYMLSHSFFLEHPGEFYAFYRSILHLNALPNRAHLGLAALERQGRLKAVITQNIDGLHQKAGSRNVLELHGSVFRNYCMDCGKSYGVEYVADTGRDVPRCSCGGIVRPDVVLFGEMLDEDVLRQSIEQTLSADLMIVAGTSLGVYPAASLVEYYGGGELVLINKSPTPLDYQATLLFPKGVGEVLGRFAAVSG